ncbi:MAG TPA: VOC family protein [Prolixibacteraceae bacterium]|nr:VOC family protein [Prolixibacteraceae bacterium]
MNVFYNTIVFVKDIKKSKRFYETIIGLKVENEYDTIVFYENHFVIHNREEILRTVFGGAEDSPSCNCPKNILIYFETDNIEESYQKIKDENIEIIHPILEQEWGQKVFRFYDPDYHLIEIGEAMHLDYLKK